MGNGDERLDALRVQFIEHRIIKCQTCFVGCFFIAQREDAAPVDAHTKALEAHFPHKRNILFVMVVKVAGTVGGVIMIFKTSKLCLFRFIERKHHLFVHTAIRHLVSNIAHFGTGTASAAIVTAHALTLGIPAALKLIGGSGTTPEEILCKSSHLVLHFFLS